MRDISLSLVANSAKILWFYFVGKFDVSPFVKMPLSVLAEVMGQIEGSGKQNALYRLLKCVQDLCDVSDRGTSGQPGNKRMKMSLFLTELKDEIGSKLTVPIRPFVLRI